ncbi:hypothetical protein AQUCO_05500136v1 [Aquilegia coerulea]|uniref:F-box domain-containing protein n=1 Tax=Aquilegia coerulea TaxID=218851 RepID=A0A2G5CID8_AQUCA|nr:hypothetical protein AQUCO_05500136v1 [Aquilegia coerulea]
MTKKAKTCNKQSLINLPEEIWYDIFSRLPVQALYQCMSVSKQWNNILNSLVADSYFAKLHYSRIHEDDDYGFFSLCCDFSNLEIISLPAAIGFDTFKEIMLFYSPAGFYFDAINNTYKVVYTCRCNNIYKTTIVEIYTLGSGRWRRILDIPNCLFFEQFTSQLFVNGALHLPVLLYEKQVNEKYIGALDIEAEMFRSFRGPPPPQDNALSRRTLCSLRESLCVFDNKGDGHIDLWIMKNYAIEDSWTKEYSIRKETPRLKIPTYFYEILTTFKHKVFLIFQNECEEYYDLEKGEFKPIQIHGIPSRSCRFCAVFHVGTISITSSPEIYY